MILILYSKKIRNSQFNFTENENCELNQYRCHSNQCISFPWYCDGDKDCVDGDDEVECTDANYHELCGYKEFECYNKNQCIPKMYLCDYEQDCQDGSDEHGCSKFLYLFRNIIRFKFS